LLVTGERVQSRIFDATSILKQTKVEPTFPN
jgi:hypothetical protein